MIAMPGTRNKKKDTGHRPPMHLRRCSESGGKLRFPTEQEAARELVECRLKYMFHNKRRRREVRVYQCREHCGDWHLTAMAEPPKHVGSSPGNGEHVTNRNARDSRNTARRQPPSASRSGGGSASGGFDSGFSGGWYDDSSSYGGGSSSSDTSSSSSSSDTSSSSSCD